MTTQVKESYSESIVHNWGPGTLNFHFVSFQRHYHLLREFIRQTTTTPSMHTDTTLFWCLTSRGAGAIWNQQISVTCTNKGKATFQMVTLKKYLCFQLLIILLSFSIITFSTLRTKRLFFLSPLITAALKIFV